MSGKLQVSIGPRASAPLPGRLRTAEYEKSGTLQIIHETDKYEDRLVILDEIHRVRELFQTLRGLIDEGRRRGRTGRFLLLGSASMDLLRQSGESLAGRIAHVDLGPLDALEVGAELTPLWVRGGFPDSFLANSDPLSFAWRKDFVRTYLDREIPLLCPRIPASTLESLWIMLAHSQGGLLNASRLATSLMVSAQSVARHIDLMVDLLLVRRLRPFHYSGGKRIVKSPKVYVRDSGIVHSLLGIADYSALQDTRWWAQAGKDSSSKTRLPPHRIVRYRASVGLPRARKSICCWKFQATGSGRLK